MIYIRIELWPANNPSNYRTLGVIKISNDLTGNDEIGNYDVETKMGEAGEPVRTKVRRHVRKRSVLYLLKRAVMGAIREGESRQARDRMNRSTEDAPATLGGEAKQR